MQPKPRDPDPEADAVDARIEYLSPGSRPSRHFLSPTGDLHTDQLDPYPVKIHNGRPLQDRFSLEEQGFVLRKLATAVDDFDDRARIDAVYPGEGVALVRALTGADVVVPLGWLQRSSARPTPPGLVSQSSDVHIDFTGPCAERLAQKVYADARPGGPPYARFIVTGMWRSITDPPQDWPFTACDARTVDPREGVAKPMVHVDVLPQGEARYAPIPNVDECLASWVAPYNPEHRWWYFPNMTRDEVLLLKHYDSGPSKALRVPHTAFRDPTFPDAPPRRSIEFRSVAFFFRGAGQ
jgi:hypothetical protein